MSFFRSIADWVSNNPWRAVGALAGFLVGVLILAIGFLNTFLIFLLALIGFVIGKIKDDNGSIISSIRDFFDRIRNR